jgi:periplasmic divalent cation tolerance protein
MLIVFCTCSDSKSAKLIARSLVEKKAAACVNVVRLEESFYRWKGKVENAKEYLLIVKIANKKYLRVEREIMRNHPYDVPEIIAVKVAAGSRKYVRWVERA